MSEFADNYPQTPFENSFFDRINDAKRIKKIINVYRTGLVLSINSPWGNGKTWFIDSFARLLIQEKYKVIQYNAWDNEIADNPFSSFVSSIYSYLELANPKFKEKKEKDKFLSIVRKVIKYTIPIATKMIIGTRIDLDNISKTGNDAVSATGDFVQELFEESTKKQDLIKEFSEVLAEYATSISVEDKPLVIFIDELDRCCPTYMIRFLEILKHFFTIENIVFIVSIDKDKICESIKHIYGNGIDPNGYLRKIIHIQYRLLNKSEGYKDDYVRVLRLLSKKDAFLQGLIQSCNLRAICIVLKHYKTTIRTIIRIFHALQNAMLVNEPLLTNYDEIVDVFLLNYILLASDFELHNKIFIEHDTNAITVFLEKIDRKVLSPRDFILKYIFTLTSLINNNVKALEIKERFIPEQEFSKNEFIALHNNFAEIISKSINDLQYLDIDV